MPVQIVPSRETGDTRYDFKVDDATAVKEAMERFDDLVKNQKRTAVALGQNGQDDRIIRAFDPNVEQTVFLPALRGG